MQRNGTGTVDRLMEFALFGGLSPDTVRAISARSKVWQLNATQTLYNSGDPCDSIFVLTHGAIRAIEHTGAGRRVTVELHAAGDLFGLSALAECRTYPNSAYALDDSEILSLHVEDAQTMLRHHLDFARLVIKVLVDRVQIAHARIKQLALEPVETRLARALLHFSGKIGKPPDLAGMTVIEASQQEVAEYCGATVETVNRFLRSWERAGWLESSRQRIGLRRPELLRELISD